MVYRADSRKGKAPKKKAAFPVSERPNIKNPFAKGGSAQRKPSGQSMSSGFGGMLQNAFQDVLGAATGAANQAHALNNPQRVAPQVTLKRKKPQGPQQSPDLLDSLMQSMLSDSASQTFDYESAIKQSEQGIRDAYAAEINAIRSNNAKAKKDTTRARKTVEAMFNGLAKSYGRASDAAEVQGDRAGKAMLNLADQASKQVAATQSKTTGEEAQMLKDLGQQDAADQIIQPDYQNTKDQNAQINKHGQRKAEAEKAYAQADARFFDRGAAGAQFEGEGRAADLLSQLQDYLQQNRGQIAGLKGDRAKEIAANKASIMQSVSDAQAKADSDLWNRMMDMANLRRQVEDTNFDNQLAAKKLALSQQQKSSASSDSYLPKNLQNAVKSLGNPQQTKKLLPILEGLWGTDPFRMGKVVKTGKGGQSQSYNMTPFEAAAMAEKAGKQAGLSQQEINLLKLAAMSSVG